MDEVDLTVPRATVCAYISGSYEIDPYFLALPGSTRTERIEKTMSNMIKENPEYKFTATPTRQGGVRIQWEMKKTDE